ncbi:hypothetical protein TVAG_276810 [Trichomonas vaginalis G3]|uniref:Uncharacterized protein n=1 Tax=Trichomonas vaginalis (strain ATCC PRA-98 / G3) TaxID=412133 RepID=A2FUE1_TRIV3|nr:hypothetical protein TVAGG3_0883940 [Trichomonas vaginalis G3]EAX91462.1 hypothetical protein TVAG_276810 [Trichomonas vaginalis G3]KAI5502250.1 hypothetical protein TVAGG3_0883940 [Trichomonas vaginalis G3]|eukprot:XP_001304392.1 hypothetical protein [Trichomonas vaginalis G3]
MPGLCYTLALIVYNIWYWYDQYVFNFYYHESESDYFYHLRGIWEEIARLAFVMFLLQIATILIAFNIEYARFLKYFNYIFFFIYLARLVACFVYAIGENIKVGRNNPFFRDYGLVYELLYGSLYLYSLILLNICLVLSNIKKYIPRKLHIYIYVSIFFFVLGLFATFEGDSFYNSNYIWKYQYINLSKLNYIKLVIQFTLNFCLDIPKLVIMWILSTNDFEDDETASSMVTDIGLIS